MLPFITKTYLDRPGSIFQENARSSGSLRSSRPEFSFVVVLPFVLRIHWAIHDWSNVMMRMRRMIQLHLWNRSDSNQRSVDHYYCHWKVEDLANNGIIKTCKFKWFTGFWFVRTNWRRYFIEAGIDEKLYFDDRFVDEKWNQLSGNDFFIG